MALRSENRLRAQFHFAGFHLGQVEYVADELEQVLAAIQNSLRDTPSASG